MAKGKALRRAHGKRYFVASRLECAAETIGRLDKGDEVCGLTCGQFSMIDILEHMLNEAGPADVFISTWTAGIYDVERAQQLAENGNIRSIRWMMDRAMFSKSPQYAGPMIEAFGLDAFRDTNVHAKVTLVASDTKRMVCRSSMNINKNLKTEQFDISVCDEVHAFFLEWADELWGAAKPDLAADPVFKVVFDKFTTLRGDAPAMAWPSARDIARNLPSASDVARRNGLA